MTSPRARNETAEAVSLHLQSIEGLAAMGELIAVGDDFYDQETRLIWSGELSAAIRLLADDVIERLEEAE